MRLDQECEGNGRVVVDTPSTRIVVGRKFGMSITYVAGAEGIKVGGSLRFKLPGFKLSDFRSGLPISCSNPEVMLRCSDTVPAVNGKVGNEFFTLDYLFLTIEGQPLRQGDTVTVDYGRSLVPFIAAPQFAVRWKVEVATDVDGTRQAPGSGFYLVQDAPIIEFIHDRPASLELTVPSHTRVGEPFEAVARVRDRYNNIVEDYTGTLKLLADCTLGAPAVESYTCTPHDRGVYTFRCTGFAEAGIHRVAVIDEAFGFYARSNPSKAACGEASYSLFWGDTHVHSSISADEAAYYSLVKRPEGDYDYARNVSDLDFCMVTDHTDDLDSEDWRETREAARKWYEPGRFVTFSGFEASHPPFGNDGDKNVYFYSDDGEYLNVGTTQDMYRHLKRWRGKAMVVPHQHARTRWELHDPELERVVEIYAHWGCGLSPDSDPPMIVGTRLRPENYVSFALEHGIKVGFIASADHSWTHPGDDFWWPFSNHHGGLAAVYAPSLTRGGVWDALWSRRCYGTTRARIILEFDINGHAMGEEFHIEPDAVQRRHLTIAANGTAPIASVEIVKNGRVLHAYPGYHALDLELRYDDQSAERDTDYYYVHVIQEDGEQAWSSPIWVTVA